jgi:cysteine synthase
VVTGVSDEVPLKLVELALLKSHEHIKKDHYKNLLKKIKENRFVRPIIVDANSHVILDGHHRVSVLKNLGYKIIPAFLVNYSDKKIKVFPRRKKYRVNKKVVVKRGLNGNPFPPKTTKHIVNRLKKFKMPLDMLDKNEENRTVLDLIGNTPIVKINKLNPNPKVKIYAKLEGSNPGGSVKDRIALRMLEEAEKNGKLTKDKIIIEPTSGNTGIGLAMVAAVKGYKIRIVMPESVSIERRKMLKALGAELVLTEAERGTDGAIMKAHEIIRKNPKKYFMPNQFANKNNVLAHYETTGLEIIRQMNGKIDVFIAGMGTTGTLMGAGKRLKEFNPNIEIIGVEPTLGHKIQGLKNMKEAIVPQIYNPLLLDEKIVVKDEDAYATARELAREEGVFVGMSSGAAMWAAIRKAKEMKKGNIVVIFPDRVEKYLSTKLFD